MKISIATHGGWGGRFAAPIGVDTAALPPELAGEAAGLAAAAIAQGTADRDAAALRSRAPDAQSYTITIEEGDRRTTLKASDVAADPHVAALIDWVKRQS